MSAKKTKEKSTLQQSENKPLLALMGQYQNGKSTLLNCLLGGAYAREGNGTVTTKYNTEYSFGEFRSAQLVVPNNGEKNTISSTSLFLTDDALQTAEKDTLLQVNVYSPLLQRLDILDSPGCGANEQDNSVAEIALQQADFVIFVVQKILDNEADLLFLKHIAETGKHFTIILNCLNERDPFSEQTQNLCQEILAQVNAEKLNRNYVVLSEEYPIYPVNLLWAQCAIGCLEAAELAKKQNKVVRLFDQEALSPASLFYASNFAPLRKALTSFVEAFYHYSPAQPLSLFPALANEWSNSLIKTIKE